MKGGKHGLAFGLAAALLLVGGPGGGISRRGSNGVVLAEARRRRRPAPPPPDTGPAGMLQEIEQKSVGTGEKYNYNQALYLSNLFYEAQRAGKLPEDNRIPWRRDSNIADGFLNHHDLSGGYYDAGDYIIFGWPLASATTVLAWGLLEYEDAYTQAGELGHMLATVKWPLDWLLKAHVAPDTLYVQVGDGKIEHKYWGRYVEKQGREGRREGCVFATVKWPLDWLLKAHVAPDTLYVQVWDGKIEHKYWRRPEFERKPRPAYQINATHPGTEPMADAAAAMAAGYLVFQHHDPIYAQTLLIHAKQLFEAALARPAKFTLSAPFYESSGYNDELAWAATWLYKATGEKAYLTKAIDLAELLGKDDVGAFGWDSKNAGVHLLLYKLTKKQKYADKFALYMSTWLPGSSNSIKRTPKGLAYYMGWGPLRWAANTAFLALLAADFGLGVQPYRQFARSQVHYILGDNGGFSYVVGFGEKGPKAIHNRGASCGRRGCECNSLPSANTLYGALVGGPDEKDGYVDDCHDYKHSECSVDYNAGYQGAVAGLKHLSLVGLLDSF